MASFVKYGVSSDFNAFYGFDLDGLLLDDGMDLYTSSNTDLLLRQTGIATPQSDFHDISEPTLSKPTVHGSPLIHNSSVPAVSSDIANDLLESDMEAFINSDMCDLACDSSPEVTPNLESHESTSRTQASNELSPRIGCETLHRPQKRKAEDDQQQEDMRVNMIQQERQRQLQWQLYQHYHRQIQFQQQLARLEENPVVQLQRIKAEIEALDFADVTVLELKKILRECGISTCGKKQELVRKIHKELASINEQLEAESRKTKNNVSRPSEVDNFKVESWLQC